MKPPSVELGLLSQADFDWLVETGPNDQQAYWDYAKELCEPDPLLFGHLYMGMAIPPHMVKLRILTKKIVAQTGRERIAVSLPRDTSKTVTNVIIRLTHRLAYRSINKTPRKATLLIKESGSEAEDKVRTIMGHFERNPYIRLSFGDVFEKDRARIWNTSQIVLDQDAMSDHPTLYAVGLGMAVTGRHPDEIILDDPVSVKNSMTPHMRGRSWEWWTGTIAPAAGPTCTITSNFTPYYGDDLNAELVRSGDFALIKMDALSRMPMGEDYEVLHDVEEDENLITGIRRTEHGRDITSIWPCPDGDCPMTEEHFLQTGLHRPVEWFLLNHARYPSSFNKSYMNVISSIDEVVMVPWSFNLWSNDRKLIGTSVRSYMERLAGYGFSEKDIPSWFVDAKIVPFPSREEVTVSVHGWDHAISRKKTSKRTAVAKGYRTTQNKVFLTHMAMRVGFMEACRMMLMQYKTDPIRRPISIISEGINFQASYQDFLNQTTDEMLPVEDVGVQVNKAVALSESGILNSMQAGQIYFQAENIDALKEHLDFTGDGRGMSDQVDATRMTFTRIRKSLYSEPTLIKINRRRMFRR